MNELALFAGAGGGILGGKLLGWRTVCAVEWEAYPASVLCARQNDGLLESFPIWDDIQTFDGKPWRGIVDVISGGFPCQDISAAGKGAGIDGKRSGMWGEMARVVGEVRPKYVFVENSPMLVNRGLERVIGDLTKIGYDTKWVVMGAADVGANHQRDRIWIVGKAQSSNANLQSTYAEQECKHDWSKESSRSRTREMGASDAEETNVSDTESCRSGRITREFQTQDEQQKTKRQKEWLWQFDNASESNDMAHARCELWDERNTAELDAKEKIGTSSSILNQPSGERFGTKQWWETEPNVGRMVNGLAAGVDRLKAIGNGQVPLCAATAWRVLTK